jgi:hypothetical protein
MSTARYFVECCDRAKAAVRPNGDPIVTRHSDQRYQVGIGPLSRTMARCSSCGGSATLVTIRLKARYGRPAPKCGGACLNGKTNCDCRCGGRCHGAGVCRCDVAVAA